VGDRQQSNKYEAIHSICSVVMLGW